MKTFKYKKLKYRYISFWKKKWFLGFFIKKNKILINEGSTSINYSQQCFEGVKVLLDKKNILNNRFNLNSFRMQKSSNFICSPIFKIFNFLIIIKIISFLNYNFIPNKKIGFLYLRPLLLGISKNIGVKTSKTFIFTIFCVPSFLNIKKINIKSILNKRVIDYLGHYKIGCNYITNIINNFNIKKYNFDDYIYINNLKFEEIGTSNFILYKKKTILSPCNKNILTGINKFFFLTFLKNKKKIKKNVFFNTIINYNQAIASGTALYYKRINLFLFKNKIFKYKNNYFNILLKYYFRKNF